MLAQTLNEARISQQRYNPGQNSSPQDYANKQSAQYVKNNTEQNNTRQTYYRRQSNQTTSRTSMNFDPIRLKFDFHFLPGQVMANLNGHTVPAPQNRRLVTQRLDLIILVPAVRL